MQYGRSVPYTLNPASYEPESNLLLRNRGDGTFDEVAKQLGVDNPTGRSLAALWHDLDDDGWPDLYVANDISDNALFRNTGGKFEDISHPAWVADHRGAMGLAAGDWNRDGDDDIHVTHWLAQENALYDNLWSDGRALRFMDVADQRGVGQIALPMVGWGTEFFDLDRDGWLDLAVANGSTLETEAPPKRLVPQRSFLFWNRRGASFHDLAPTSPALAIERVSRGLALSDYDEDGDVDLLIVVRDGGPRLLRNDTEGGNWIELRLSRETGTIETAQVSLRLGDLALRRSPDSVSYLSQSSRTLHFGLGQATAVDTIEVRWPGGGQDVWRNVRANAIWDLAEGEPAPRAAAGGSRAHVAEFWRVQRAAMNAMKKDRDAHAAIALFREALGLDPDHEDSLYYLANCQADLGDVASALATLDELKRKNPMSHRAFLRWGTLRAVSAGGAEDLDSAARSLERAVEINPEETGALQALGEVELLRGNTAEARRRFEWIARTNAQPAQALFFLGYLAWRDGDAAAARSFLERSKAARGKDWKPAGATAEGDTERRMHEERTPLGAASDAWDGSLEPDAVYRAIEERLGR
jgi:tetratricopeptide (TPR) repeat protein